MLRENLVNACVLVRVMCVKNLTEHTDGLYFSRRTVRLVRIYA